MEKLFAKVNTTVGGKVKGSFDVQAELKKHAWMPHTDALEAESILANKSVYTYLLRPCEFKRGFAISFVQKNGSVKHDYFNLINPKYGIWRNGGNDHVGKLEKVIRDMMHCSMEEGQPLA